jgi:hypothetical protein
MKRSANKVLRYLAGNENIEAISTDDLRKFADEHPYFPIAQFLLAKKLKADNSSHFLQQAQKTALYFSNPYWLNYQLTNESWQNNNSEEEVFVAKEAENKQSLAIQEISENERSIKVTDSFLSSNDGANNKTGDKVQEEIKSSTGKINNEEVQSADINLSQSVSSALPESEEIPTQAEEETAAITRDTDPATAGFLNQRDTTEETFNRDNIDQVIFETGNPAVLEATEVIEEMAGVSRETDEKTEEFLTEAQNPAEEIIVSRVLQTSVQPFTPGIDEKDIEKPKAEPDEHERMFQNIKAMLDATTEEADADMEDAVIPIDPYYTVDYFASQGIKLELEQNPKDQLGQNLKKFTQWLKHMKKLGPEDATEVIVRTDTEADIPKIAESSNTVREVVTEAMASVLEKQGKNDKAIELYKKLSFLNPGKSAYFAAKIKNLKGI